MALANDIMVKLGKNLAMTDEIRPTDVAAVLAPNKEGKMLVFPMLWGFWVDGYNTPIMNCRIETTDSKPLWKDSWFRRRCVILASWYYEWEHFSSSDGKRKKTGDKYSIQPKGSDNTYLAGLYCFEEHGGLQVPVFSVLTRTPSESVSRLHDRMPVILGKETVESWIRPDGNQQETSKKALTEMVVEKAV